MAEILFKRGKEAALKALGTYTDGCFYLTTDSHRIFMGQSDSPEAAAKLVAISEGIEVVQTLEDLPASTAYGDDTYGQFFYVEQGNIFCVRDPDKGWLQINGDVGGKAGLQDVTVKTTDNKDGTVTITYSITNGEGKTTDRPITLKNAGGLEITATEEEPYEITFTLPVYSIAGSYEDTDKTWTVKLSNNKNDTTTQAQFVFGDGLTMTAGVISAKEGSGVDTFTIEPTTEGFLFKLGLKGGGEKEATVKPTFKIGADNSTTVKYKADGSIELPVYTQSEIDAKFMGLDAMSYKGTVGHNESATVQELPTETVSAGDTYLVISETSDGGDQTGKAGDLFIAYGTEDSSTGYLTEVKWSLVPAGDDAVKDFLADCQITDNKLVVSEKGQDAVLFSLQLKAGTAMAISSTKDGAGKAMTTTISHANVPHTTTSGSAVKQATGAEMIIPVITGITVNEQGHVTSVETTDYTVVDEGIQAATLKKQAVIVAQGKDIQLETQLTVENADGDEITSAAHVDLKSVNDCLKISSADSNSSITWGLEWGTF